MRVSVFFDAVFSRVTGTSQVQVEVREATLKGLVAALGSRFGDGLKEALLTADGSRLAPGLTVLQEGRQLLLESPLKGEGEVAFLMAVAGGQGG